MSASIEVTQEGLRIKDLNDWIIFMVEEDECEKDDRLKGKQLVKIGKHIVYLHNVMDLGEDLSLPDALVKLFKEAMILDNDTVVSKIIGRISSIGIVED